MAVGPPPFAIVVEFQIAQPRSGISGAIGHASGEARPLRPQENLAYHRMDSARTNHGVGLRAAAVFENQRYLPLGLLQPNKFTVERWPRSTRYPYPVLPDASAHSARRTI